MVYSASDLHMKLMRSILQQHQQCTLYSHINLLQVSTGNILTNKLTDALRLIDESKTSWTVTVSSVVKDLTRMRTILRHTFIQT